MATLTVQDQEDITDEPTFVAASVSPGDQFRNNDDLIYLWVKNSHISNIKKLVVTSNRDSDFGAFPVKIIPVTANSLIFTLAFDGRRFNSDTGGMVTFYFTDNTGDADDPGSGEGATDVTIAAVRFGRYFRE